MQIAKLALLSLTVLSPLAGEDALLQWMDRIAQEHLSMANYQLG